MTYSFLDVQAAIVGPGGSLPLGSGSGNAKEGITIEMVEDKNRMTIGADGSQMHSLIASQAARVTIRLLKTSPLNAALAGMYNYQTRSSLFHGISTLVVTDFVRGDVYTCTNVAFSKFPKNDYAEEAGMIEWVFDAGKAIPVLGANPLALVA